MISAYPSKNRAFSLIEMAVVIGLIGLIAGYMLMATHASKDANCYVETKDKIAKVQEAVERFAMSKDRFPMPAKRNVGVGSSEYGREAVIADLDIPGSGIKVPVYGAVPFQALGIPVENAVDCWGNKLTYAVTKDLTESAKFLIPATAGALEVRSSATDVRLQEAGYAIISHGADELGAVKNNFNDPAADNATKRKWCMTPNGLRTENCDVANNILVDTKFNDGNDAGNLFFDDLLAYRGKPWRQGSVAAPTPGNLYQWGHLHNAYIQYCYDYPSSCPYPTYSQTPTELQLWGMYTPSPTSFRPGWNLKFTEAGAGQNHYCALADKLTLIKDNINWGSSFGNDSNTLPAGTTVNVAKGNLYCWGLSDDTVGRGPRSMSGTDVYYWDSVLGPGYITIGDVVSFDTGIDHTCALTGLGKIHCWGKNDFGQLGNLTGNLNVNTGLPPTPIDVSATPGLTSGTKFKEVATGQYHSCAIADNDKTYCWGNNPEGQLGIGTAGGTQSRPVEVDMSALPAGTKFLKLTAGGWHTCAMAQLPTKTVTTSAAGGIGDTNISIVASTGVHNSIVSGHAAIEDGTYIPSYDGSSTATILISPGLKAPLPSGTVLTLTPVIKTYCWGRGTEGQLGNGIDMNPRTKPMQPVKMSYVYPNVYFTSISAGKDHNCAMGSDQQAHCWGSNYWGQLGVGTSGSISTLPTAPVDMSAYLVPVPVRLVSVSAGDNYTCGIGSNKKGYCWGVDNTGTLADGPLNGSGRTKPFPIVGQGSSPPPDLQYINASDFTVFAW